MGLFAQQTFIAHRGASYLAPENTVAAANLAWDVAAGLCLVREAGGVASLGDAPADWVRTPGLALFAGEAALVDEAIAVWRAVRAA